MAVESLPDFCLRHCFEKWGEALKTQAGDIDDYETGTEDCSHIPVVHSHESLQAVDSSSLRLYSIVDMCEDCGLELQETTYKFDCGNNWHS